MEEAGFESDAEKGGAKGELSSYMKDFKSESEDMINNLLYVDSILSNLQERIDTGETIKPERLLEVIRDIRLRIGDIRKEEEVELSEEIIARNLLNKLKKWIDAVV